MKPKNNEKNNDFEYERVKTGDFVLGVIAEIQREEEHSSTFEGKQTVRDCVRFKFDFPDYEHPHYSKWLTFSYSEKATLYKMFLTKLVEGAEPYMDFDITKLVGMQIKTLWSETEKNGQVYQNLDTIAPVKEKVKLTEGGGELL